MPRFRTEFNGHGRIFKVDAELSVRLAPNIRLNGVINIPDTTEINLLSDWIVRQRMLTDGDGYRSTEFGGQTDCFSDSNHLISPAAGHRSDPSLCMQDEDADGYGNATPPEGVSHERTAMTRVQAHLRGSPDIMGDGVDSDCLGGAEFDFDGDGHDGIVGGLDCDDSNQQINPSATGNLV